MLTNKRPRKSQLYSVEACRVRIIIDALRAKGLGWEDICRVLEQKPYYMTPDRKQVRAMVLTSPPLSKRPNEATPNYSEPSKASSDESASTINSSLHQP